jgi:hypothetical protein
LCRYKHSENVCEIFLKGGKCFRRNRSSRHPNNCKYEKQGCFRRNLCAYKHINSEQRKDSLNVSDEKLDVEKVHEDVEEVIIIDKMNEDDANDNDNETNVANVKCGKWDIEGAKNECEQCGKYICSICEIKVHGTSVREFLNENNFLNYSYCSLLTQDMVLEDCSERGLSPGGMSCSRTDNFIVSLFCFI